MKTCRTCQGSKPLESFVVKSSNTDGRSTQCKKCDAAKRQKDRRDNPIRVCIRKMIGNARGRARKHTLPFGIKQSDVAAIWPDDDNCTVCGQVLNLTGGGSMAPDSATLDRILPEFGYVVHNIQVLCSCCNTAKGSMDIPTTKKQLVRMISAERKLGRHVIRKKRMEQAVARKLKT